jgi:hypothetical protein
MRNTDPISKSNVYISEKDNHHIQKRTIPMLEQQHPLQQEINSNTFWHFLQLMLGSWTHGS